MNTFFCERLSASDLTPTPPFVAMADPTVASLDFSDVWK